MDNRSYPIVNMDRVSVLDVSDSIPTVGRGYLVGGPYRHWSGDP